MFTQLSRGTKVGLLVLLSVFIVAGILVSDWYASHDAAVAAATPPTDSQRTFLGLRCFPAPGSKRMADRLPGWFQGVIVVILIGCGACVIAQHIRAKHEHSAESPAALSDSACGGSAGIADKQTGQPAGRRDAQNSTE